MFELRTKRDRQDFRVAKKIAKGLIYNAIDEGLYINRKYDVTIHYHPFPSHVHAHAEHERDGGFWQECVDRVCQRCMDQGLKFPPVMRITYGDGNKQFVTMWMGDEPFDEMISRWGEQLSRWVYENHIIPERFKEQDTTSSVSRSCGEEPQHVVERKNDDDAGAKAGD